VGDGEITPRTGAFSVSPPVASFDEVIQHLEKNIQIPAAAGVYECVYVCVCVCVCVYVCVCERERVRERDREREKVWVCECVYVFCMCVCERDTQFST